MRRADWLQVLYAWHLLRSLPDGVYEHRYTSGDNKRLHVKIDTLQRPARANLCINDTVRHHTLNLRGLRAFSVYEISMLTSVAKRVLVSKES